MKSFLSAVVILFALTATTSATLGSGAPAIGAVLDTVVVLQHDHCHDVYDDSFGSHGLENAVAALNVSMAGYLGGTVTESQVFADATIWQNAVQNYIDTITAAGVLGQGDAVLDAQHQAIVNLSFRMAFQLKDLDPFGS